MVDINLLPEEQRKKEEEAKKGLSKKPQVFELHLTSPEKMKPEETVRKPPFFKKWFGVKKRQPQEPPAQISAQKQEVQEEEETTLSPPKEPVRFETIPKLPEEDYRPKKVVGQGGLLEPLKTQKPQSPAPVAKEQERALGVEGKETEKEPTIVLERGKVSEIPKTKIFSKAEKHHFDVLSWIRRLWQPKISAKVVSQKKEEKWPRPKKEKEAPLGINLIPQELEKPATFDIRRKLLLFGAVMAGSILLLFISAWLLKIYQGGIGKEISQSKARMDELQKQIDGFERVVAEANELNEILSRVEFLLGEHLYWTKIFEALERYTIDDVYFESFVAASNGDVLMSAVGRNYNALARQLLMFQNAKDFIQDVQINGGQSQVDPIANKAGQVRFDVKVTLNPNIFIIKFQKEKE